VPWSREHTGIARELHGEIGQLFALLAFNLP